MRKWQMARNFQGIFGSGEQSRCIPATEGRLAVSKGISQQVDVNY
jgi:hypothetical protein